MEVLKSKITFQKKQMAVTMDAILPALQKNYNSSLLAFEQNNGDLFVVLDAWQMMQTTQLNYLDQLQQLFMLQIDYEKELQIR
jgi:cobalt-zinc-cadmium efflux system outer membrane protein